MIGLPPADCRNDDQADPQRQPVHRRALRLRSHRPAGGPDLHRRRLPAGTGEVAGVGDIQAQASLAVANLSTALAASGATLRDVLKTTVFVASAQRADLVTAWDVIRAAFGDHDAPSTLLGVTVLGYPGQLVELEAVAAIAL